MELKEAIEILERHNKWRRGAEIPQESPGELGIAIDTAIAYSTCYVSGFILIFSVGNL